MNGVVTCSEMAQHGLDPWKEMLEVVMSYDSVERMISSQAKLEKTALEFWEV
jgi:hypothetical protein